MEQDDLAGLPCVDVFGDNMKTRLEPVKKAFRSRLLL